MIHSNDDLLRSSQFQKVCELFKEKSVNFSLDCTYLFYSILPKNYKCKTNTIICLEHALLCSNALHSKRIYLIKYI